VCQSVPLWTSLPAGKILYERLSHKNVSPVFPKAVGSTRQQNSCRQLKIRTNILKLD